MAAEVSSAGWRKPCDEQYPAPGLLERFVARGVGFTTASDAHGESKVADRADDLRALLESSGIDRLVAFEAAPRRRSVPLTEAAPAGKRRE